MRHNRRLGYHIAAGASVYRLGNFFLGLVAIIALGLVMAGQMGLALTMLVSFWLLSVSLRWLWRRRHVSQV